MRPDIVITVTFLRQEDHVDVLVGANLPLCKAQAVASFNLIKRQSPRAHQSASARGRNLAGCSSARSKRKQPSASRSLASLRSLAVVFTNLGCESPALAFPTFMFANQTPARPCLPLLRPPARTHELYFRYSLTLALLAVSPSCSPCSSRLLPRFSSKAFVSGAATRGVNPITYPYV